MRNLLCVCVLLPLIGLACGKGKSNKKSANPPPQNPNQTEDPAVLNNLGPQYSGAELGGEQGEPGKDGKNGKDGKDGQAAFSIVYRVLDLEAGEQCPAGGKLLHLGQDSGKNEAIAHNGELEDGEITEEVMICNGLPGSNGPNTLMRKRILETSSEECPELGGVQISIGLDDGAGDSALAQNTQLEDGEILDSFLVCNGAKGENGVAGADGTNGLDGISALFKVESLPELSTECNTGGIVLHYGLDNGRNNGIAGNQSLEDGEVVGSTHVCNGTQAKQADSQGPLLNGIFLAADFSILSIDHQQYLKRINLGSNTFYVERGWVTDLGSQLLFEPKSLQCMENDQQQTLLTSDMHSNMQSYKGEILASLKKDRETHTNSIEEHRVALNDVSRAIEQGKQNISRKKIEQKEYDNVIQSLSGQLDEISGRIKQEEEQLKIEIENQQIIQANIQRKSDNEKHLASELTVMEQEHKAREKEKSTLETTLEKLRDQRKTVKIELEKQTESVNELSKNHEQLSKEISDILNKLTLNLSAEEKTDLELLLTKLENDLKELQTKLAEKERAKATAMKEILNLNTEEKNLTNELTKKKEQLETKVQALANKRNEIDSARKEIGQSKAELNEIDLKVMKFQSKITDLNSQMTEKSAKISKNQGNIAETDSQIKTINDQIKMLADQQQQAKEKIRDLDAELAAIEQRINLIQTGVVEEYKEWLAMYQIGEEQLLLGNKALELALTEYLRITEEDFSLTMGNKAWVSCASLIEHLIENVTSGE